MATRSLVALETSEDIHDCIYIHWDGHPDTRLPILKHYNTIEQVQTLIELGDCSTLANTLEDSRFYHRDMGRILNVRKNIKNIKNHADNCDCEYLYIMKLDGLWYWERLY